MKKIGLYIEGGGNKVFFANGVLKVFNENKIKVDHVFGISSSSAILFAYLFNCNNFVLKIFGKKLRENKRNFYYFKKKHFPQNDIYKNSIEEMFEKYFDNFKDKNLNYTIIASSTSIRFKRLKGVFASFSLILDIIFLKILPKNYFLKLIKKVFNISEFYFYSSKEHTSKDIINVIMGSSTIYPFIDLHTYRNKLILEGSFAQANYNLLLEKYEKKIVIHNDFGKTQIRDNTLHIYSSIKIPENILDYTDENKIINYHNAGEIEAKRNLGLIKSYLS